MSRPGRTALAGALLATLWLPLLPASPARADLQWYQHYERGLEAAERGEWSAALTGFEAAARLRPEAGARVRTYGSRFLFGYDPAFQRARCLLELRRLADARAALAEAAAAGVTPEADLAALRRRLVAAEAGAAREPEAAEVPVERVTVREPGPWLDAETDPPGAVVLVDGRPVGTTPFESVRLAPGRHRFTVRAAGRETWEEVMESVPGERLHLDLTLAALPAAAPPPPPSRRPEEEPEPVDPHRPAETEAAVPASPGTGSAAPATETTEGAGELREPPVPSPARTAPPAADPGARDVGAGEPPPRPRWPPSGGLLAVLAALTAGVLLAGLSIRRRRAAGRPAPSIAARLPGRAGRVGRYRVVDELGRGGMATTYRAFRVRDRLPVALKIPHETGDPTYLPRFLQEGRLGETLHHPRIVRILEAGEEEGRPFLAMELIPGTTLRAVLDAEGPRPVRQALEIARDVAEALDYAHGKGVVHRDLKPENVMLLPDGTVKVMDFGVARVEGQPGLTTSRFFFGSPVYAAPEVVDPGTLDRRADLYSLGVVLFELLEGHPPFHHESVYKLLEMHQREPLPPPEELPRPLPPEVWRILVRLLAKDPEERPASAEELLVELRSPLYELPADAQWTREWGWVGSASSTS